MLLEDVRRVCEASTSLRTMPDPYHHPEPWMKLLGNQRERVEAVRQLNIRCTKPKKPECARCASDEELRTNPLEFVCMLCPADKRRCCNTASALVSHQHRSHGYHNPFRRANG